MNQNLRTSNQVVYVVANLARNDRIYKILSLKNLFHKMVLVSAGSAQVNDGDMVIKPFPNPLGILRLMKLHKLKNTLDKYLFFPSRQILYVKAAQEKLKDVILNDLKSGKTVCLLTSIPEHDLAIIGLFVKRHVPSVYWIVDWQDLWSYDENYFYRVPKLYRKRLLKLERQVLENSDLNVTTNLNAKAVLERRYEVPSSRVLSIPHHFYRGDLPDSSVAADPPPIAEKNGAIRIGFLGTLFKPPRVPGSRVVEAIRNLRISGMNVELHVYGGVPSPDEISLWQNDSLFFHGKTSHAESLRRILNCHFLLLLLADLPNCRAVMSIKLPHYLALRRPILAIVPDQSAVADIVRRTGSGHVIPAENDWGEGLRKVLQDHLNGSAPPERNESAIEAYSWENISKQWVEVIRVALPSPSSAVTKM